MNFEREGLVRWDGAMVDDGYGIVGCSGQMAIDLGLRESLYRGLDRVVCSADCRVHVGGTATGSKNVVYIDATFFFLFFPARALMFREVEQMYLRKKIDTLGVWGSLWLRDQHRLPLARL